MSDHTTQPPLTIQPAQVIHLLRETRAHVPGTDWRNIEAAIRAELQKEPGEGVKYSLESVVAAVHRAPGVVLSKVEEAKLALIDAEAQADA